MKKCITICMAVMFVFVLAACNNHKEQNNPSEKNTAGPIVWVDPAMEQYVREESGIAEGDIYPEDIIFLHRPILPAEVEKLDDLVHFPHAIFLALHGDYTDFTPLAAMSALTEVRFYNGQSDGSDLGGLELLREQLDSISFTDFPNLTDISFLAQFRSLSELSFERCTSLTDFTPIQALTQLEGLYVRYCGIRDIGFVSGLTQLQVLSLNDNQIADLSPISTLTKLETFYGFNNQIQDISPLSNLTQLKTLILYLNEITDISPLKDLTGLTELNLNRNQVTDISVLANLVNLEKIMLSDNPITDLSPLSKLDKLVESDVL